MTPRLDDLERLAKETIDWISKLDVPVRERMRSLGKIEMLAKRLGREAFDAMRDEQLKG